jgi:hypothetical protein
MHSGYIGIAIDLAAARIQSQLILTVSIALASHAASLPGPIFNPSGGGRCLQLYLGLRRTIRYFNNTKGFYTEISDGEVS